jgi:hypothetical protein
MDQSYRAEGHRYTGGVTRRQGWPFARLTRSGRASSRYSCRPAPLPIESASRRAWCNVWLRLLQEHDLCSASVLPPMGTRMRYTRCTRRSYASCTTITSIKKEHRWPAAAISSYFTTIRRIVFPVCLHARSDSTLSHGQQMSRKGVGHAPAVQARPPEKRHTSAGRRHRPRGRSSPPRC